MTVIKIENKREFFHFKKIYQLKNILFRLIGQ